MDKCSKTRFQKFARGRRTLTFLGVRAAKGMSNSGTGRTTKVIRMPRGVIVTCMSKDFRGDVNECTFNYIVLAPSKRRVHGSNDNDSSTKITVQGITKRVLNSVATMG